jgi:hypothetical protein
MATVSGPGLVLLFCVSGLADKDHGHSLVFGDFECTVVVGIKAGINFGHLQFSEGG